MFFKLKSRWNPILCLTSFILLFNQGYADTNSNTQVIQETSDQFITWTYNETPMGLYLPEITDTPLPVVMFLHGCNNNPISRYHWIISALN